MHNGRNLNYPENIAGDPNQPVDQSPLHSRQPIPDAEHLPSESFQPSVTPPKACTVSHRSHRRGTTWGGSRATTQKQDAPSTTASRRAKAAFRDLLVPEREVGRAPGVLQQLKVIVFGTWTNVLLLAIPVSWALHLAKPEEVVLTFIFSFLAIIPLAKLLAFATDELSIRVGSTLARLLNATLGNAVELIIAILALVRCELRIVQSSFIGSMLSNILLVPGLCFFAGGTRFGESEFAAIEPTGASQLTSSLLTISVICILIPATFNMPADSGRVTGFDDQAERQDVLKLSYGIAIVLLLVYLSYLWFQLVSHSSFSAETSQRPRTVKYTPHSGLNTRKFADFLKLAPAKERGNGIPLREPKGIETIRTDGTPAGAGSWQIPDEERRGAPETDYNGEDEETPELSLPVIFGLLITVTVLVAVTAEWLVASIDGLASTGGIPKQFIGLILLPIVGNATEHVTAISTSVKDKLTFSIRAAVERSIQIALFVIPSTVVLGWIIHRPLTMLFDPFESVVLFFSVLTISYVTQDGKSNWLRGVTLICLYVIVAVTLWFYSGAEPTGILACSA